MKQLRSIFCIGTISILFACGVPSYADHSHDIPEKHDKSVALSVTHGVTIGDVTARSAVIWSRTNREGDMHARLIGPKDQHKTVAVSSGDDFTGKILFGNLRPDTRYRYQVWFGGKGHGKRSSNIVDGSFRTAPSRYAEKSISFAWGGDIGGQNVCRDENHGYPLFQAVNEMEPDFFVGLGDMIYADGVCKAIGRYGNSQIVGEFDRSATLEDYWGHWKYNRAEENLLELLAHTPYVAIWDDHEVANDFGPLHDTRDTPPYTPGVHLLPMGLKAFLDYNPIADDPRTPKRLYRSIRWGKHLELIVLDTRQYRDANGQTDNARFPKTMLGKEQLTWLKETLQKSDATWKVIVSSVPLSIPTGFPPGNGRDGWANFDQDTGFEHELLQLVNFMHKSDIRNVVFITTDVHFAEVFRYRPFTQDPDFEIHEFVSGPMNAGLFPNRNFDDTLHPEQLFFYGPESSAAVTSYEEALDWFNFGLIRIDADGRLRASIVNHEGSLFQLDLDPR